MYHDHTVHMSHLGRSGTLLDPPNTHDTGVQSPRHCAILTLKYHCSIVTDPRHCHTVRMFLARYLSSASHKSLVLSEPGTIAKWQVSPSQAWPTNIVEIRFENSRQHSVLRFFCQKEPRFLLNVSSLNLSVTHRSDLHTLYSCNEPIALSTREPRREDAKEPDLCIAILHATRPSFKTTARAMEACVCASAAKSRCSCTEKRKKGCSSTSSILTQGLTRCGSQLCLRCFLRLLFRLLALLHSLLFRLLKK